MMVKNYKNETVMDKVWFLSYQEQSIEMVASQASSWRSDKERGGAQCDF